ncbi:AAA family ATPase [Spirosoma sp. KUDC1026]|uniref:AAA family ATPase n=1 Tax=Spirosoma sp. KUDC1026 TaxID=2745947 RepID=UPI00159B8F2E|nr:AAA family ATPase [Spirosoma sp. KUDC1026]QKZ14268.1 AAA family ATPase [Spirosoma sp. KUDC1026]
MYIRKVNIENIRSIDRFQMAFPEGKEAGWHVLIGDNGAGKSTIIRSAALAMLDVADVNAARQNWNDWLQTGQRIGNIDVVVVPDSRYDSTTGPVQNRITFEGKLVRDEEGNILIPDSQASLLEIIFRGRKVYGKQIEASPMTMAPVYTDVAPAPAPNPSQSIETKLGVWFSVAYGPFRRFTGGNADKDSLFISNPHLGAHLSAFGEDVALTEALTYLEVLYIRSLELFINGKVQDQTFDQLKQFINQADLLPHGAVLEDISLSAGMLFRDGNGFLVDAIQMSDGYRSVLSMTIELIRQLIRSYGPDLVFANVRNGGKTIDLPGVVLIDEIDAHLHPTWQTRIGQWFTKYFPNLQFIVTTHSPLVCRAAEKGSIWRLAAPGSDQVSGEVTGVERDRLVFGNVLDAYGTEVFGQNVERSEHSKNKLQQLAHLSQLNAYGQISDDQKKELQELRKILITDDTTEF